MSVSKNEQQYDPRARRNQLVPSRDLALWAALSWLKLGWKDFKQAPALSLLYGLMVFLVTALITWLAWKLGGYVLLISALSGFIFIAPLLAFALYSVSRELELGKTPSLGHTFRAIRRPLSNRFSYRHLVLKRTSDLRRRCARTTIRQ